MSLQKIICTSVIRSTHHGESHGGCYIVDIENEEITQLIDWNDGSISWEGRGNERGLRGIAFFEKKIYIAASNEIFAFDSNFKIIKSYRNKYLRFCHEIFAYNNLLYLTSTGFNTILVFDLCKDRFIRGYYIEFKKLGRLNKIIKRLFQSPSSLALHIFDPEKGNGPSPEDTLHINSVYVKDNIVFFSGTEMNTLQYIQKDKLEIYGYIPYGTHNVMPYDDNIVFNDTNNNQLVILTVEGHYLETFDIKLYNESELLMNNLPKDHARQGFGRGLAITKNGLIIGGSSPATISVYKRGSKRAIKSINITMDVRNSIHGLEMFEL